ncbi:MAG: hypothetical protein U0M05_00775 [Clostridia bacterium]|jgi:glutathione peroxidase-family protein|nr:hypothetical protein [Clostridia bacterium]
MENASKALIIAGAILLAILIIGLGIFIYRQAANTVSDTGMDQLAIQQFNGQFENYIKDNVSGATVKSLIQLVKTNNAVEDSSKTITLNYETGLNESGINSVEKYDVSVKNASGNDGYVNGVIKNILIKKHVEKKSGE